MVQALRSRLGALQPPRKSVCRQQATTAATAPAPRTLYCAPLPLQALRRRVPARAAEVSQAATTEQQDQELSVELPTADVQRFVQLMGVVQGRGAAIVVAAVEPGSAAAAAGVRPGQQLLAVSDPIRRAEMWELNPQASLRYTRQAIRMRVADTIALRLTARAIPEWQDVVAAKRAEAQAAAAAAAGAVQQAAGSAGATSAAAAAAGTSNGGSASSAAAPAQQEEPEDLLSAIVRSMSSVDEADMPSSSLPSPSPLASLDSPSAAPGAAAGGSGPSSSRPLTVAERLEQQYAAQQAGEAEVAPLVQRQLTDLERRQRRRKEYFEQASQRNDAPFFAAVAALFVVPPAVILLWAFTSGYVDSLDMYGMLR